MIMDAIRQAFERAEKEQWWKLYVAVDVHGVIFESTKDPAKQRVFIPGAKEILQYLASREDITLLIWSCSHPKEIRELKQFFATHNINFEYYLENPEVENDNYGFYEYKPYYNLLLDDKAGFNPNLDWLILDMEFRKHPILDQSRKHIGL